MTELGGTDETTTAESVPNQLARWAFGGPISPRDYAVVRHAWARRGLLVEDSEVEATVRELPPWSPRAGIWWSPAAGGGQAIPTRSCSARRRRGPWRALAVYGILREADVVLNLRLAALAGPADEATRSALQGLLSYARLLYRAQPFFLPAATAVGLMASHPPDEAGLAELLPPETQPRLAEAKASIPDVGLGAELGQTMVLNLARLGSYASGVVLFSRPDGGLADEMLWLLATDPDPDPDSADASLDRLRAVLPAYRSRATLALLVANIAAAVAWASWRTESPLKLPARDSQAMGQGCPYQPVPQARATGRRRRARPRRHHLHRLAHQQRQCRRRLTRHPSPPRPPFGIRVRGVSSPYGPRVRVVATDCTIAEAAATKFGLGLGDVDQLLGQSGVPDGFPFLVHDDGEYDSNLNPILRLLPTYGVRSYRSIATYAAAAVGGASINALVAGGTDALGGLQVDEGLEHELHGLAHEVQVAAGAHRIEKLGQGTLVKGHRGVLLRDPG